MAPRHLKSSLAPPFDGPEQHDSAELLHYVLDALEHEDLLPDASDADANARRLETG